jgi:hypothetical protein
LRAVRPGGGAQVLDCLSSVRTDPPVKSWLAKPIWSRSLDPLWLTSSAGRNSLIDEDLVEGVPDELFNIRFRETELQDRNLNAALAQLRDVGPSGNRMLKTVDRIDSRNRSRWTVYPQVDSDDGVAITIDPCQLIKVRSVQDGFGVI